METTDKPPEYKDTRPTVMVAVPYDRVVVGPFFQSFLHILSYPYIKWIPFPTPGASIHLSRDAMIKAARANESVDFLMMIDSDQTLNPLTIPRLVSHNVPLVGPCIVQRNGDPIPVAYKELGKDKFWRYEPLIAEILCYLDQFSDEKFTAGAGDVILPIERDHEPDPAALVGMPDSIKEGLTNPLLPVDAIGGGGMLWRRDAFMALEPEPETGLLCFPGETLVSVPGGLDNLRTVYRRWYDGDLVEIETASGHKLSGTPNHPILTPQGWRPLGELVEGDDTFSRPNAQERSLVDHHEDDVNIPIGQIFDLAADFGLVDRHTGSDDQFHGDGQHGNVDVVWATRELRNHLRATLAQPSHEHFFSRSSLRTPFLTGTGFGDMLSGPLGTPLLWPFVASQIPFHVLSIGPDRDAALTQQVVNAREVNAINTVRNPVGRLAALVSGNDFVFTGQQDGMRVVDAPPVLTTPQVRPGHPACFGATAPRDPSFRQEFPKGTLTDSFGVADVLGSFPGDVARDKIIRVSRHPFSGHVYNLQTVQHSYIAQHIITQNCSFVAGGEDFSLCRGLRNAGYGGINTPGPKGHGIYVDRGCWSGHLSFFAKGPLDLIRWTAKRTEELAAADSHLPGTPELLERINASPRIGDAVGNGHVPQWLAETTLPGMGNGEDFPEPMDELDEESLLAEKEGHRLLAEDAAAGFHHLRSWVAPS